MDFQWSPQKMRKTKKKQNEKQNLMTHPTLEEKTKIKEELVTSSYIENDVAGNPRIQSHDSQETSPENYEPPEKKKCKEKEGKTIDIFTNIPDIPLREVILRNGCHGLSPLDIKFLDTNVNNNEKIQFQRYCKSYQVGWLHDEVINSFMFRLTRHFTDTIYCASSEALLIANGKSFGKKIFIPFNPNNLHWLLININIEKERSYLIHPMNKTIELYRDLAMVHSVVRRIFHKLKKAMTSPIEAIDHTLQRDSRSCGVYVCYYEEKIAKGE